jgi:hypothetical protein
MSSTLDGSESQVTCAQSKNALLSKSRKETISFAPPLSKVESRNMRDVGAQSKRLIAVCEPKKQRPPGIQTQATATQARDIVS